MVCDMAASTSRLRRHCGLLFIVVVVSVACAVSACSGVQSCMAMDLPVSFYCFIAPPSLDELERRLRGRGTDSEEAIKVRLANAVQEIERARDISFDLWLVNDDLDAAYRYG